MKKMKTNQSARKITNNWIWVCLAVAALMSCNKYLDKKSNDVLITPSTISDLQKLLDDITIMNNLTGSMGETSADDYFVLPDTYSVYPVSFQAFYSWTPYDYTFGNDWSTGYQSVYNANLCIDQLGKIGQTPANIDSWNNIKGSALFYRSYTFLWLLWDYGKTYDSTSSKSDLGIVLRLGSDFNTKSVRATVEECYAEIIADVKEAIPLLPDYPQIVTRPSKVAGYSLLARCYLSMREYGKAELYADSSLKMQSSLMDFHGDSNIKGLLTARTPFVQFNKEIIFYSESNNYMNFSVTDRMVDTLLYATYKNGDLRKDAFFYQTGNYYQYKGSYTSYMYTLFSGLAVDEMYLIKAECLARRGKGQEALNELNTLVSKRSNNVYNDAIAGNVNAVRDTVLSERRKELLMRGLRWPDIKRLNKEGHDISLVRLIGQTKFGLPPNSNYYALPLPRDMIDQTGIPQNK